MIPVRRLRQVDLGQLGPGQLGDEHRRHAVQARAPLVGHGLQHGGGVEGGRRDHHRGAVGGAPEVAQDHAEAVVEGHGDAHPVGLGVAAALAHEVAVVEDVGVAERGALRVAGGARRVLDVDRVVGLRPAARCPHRRLVHVVGRVQERVPLVGAEVHDPLERVDARPDLVEHGAVVRREVRLGRHDEPAARLGQRVGQLGRAVRRVDVHEDHAGSGGGVLQVHPLVAVRVPRCRRGHRPRCLRRSAPAPGGRRPRRARRRSGGRPGARPRVPRGRGGGARSPPGCRRWSARAAAHRWVRQRTTRSSRSPWVRPSEH